MTATIYISGVIGEDFTLKNAMTQLGSFADVDSVNVIIDTVGGSVEEGMAIFSWLRGLGKPIKTVARRAYSIGSVIFCAGDERVVERGTGELMIHMPWAHMAGGADDFMQVAMDLKELEEEFIAFYGIYFKNSTPDAIRQLLKNETFIDADEALELGLATTIEVPLKAVAYLPIIETKKEERKTTKIMNDVMLMLNKILAVVSPKIQNLVVQDANGVEIDFKELEENDPIEVGDKADVDGSPAEGEYVMPDGSTYVFSNGELQEVRPAQEEEVPEAPADEEPEAKAEPEVEAKVEGEVEVKAEDEEVEQLKETLNTLANDLAAEIKESNEVIAALKEEITTLKGMISSDPLEVNPLAESRNEKKKEKITGAERAAMYINKAINK